MIWLFAIYKYLWHWFFDGNFSHKFEDKNSSEKFDQIGPWHADMLKSPAGNSEQPSSAMQKHSRLGLALKLNTLAGGTNLKADTFYYSKKIFGPMNLFLCLTQLHKTYTLAGFQPGSFFPSVDAISTAPHHQGEGTLRKSLTGGRLFRPVVRRAWSSICTPIRPFADLWKNFPDGIIPCGKIIRKSGTHE
jgi:hypothetical protein